MLKKSFLKSTVLNDKTIQNDISDIADDFNIKSLEKFLEEIENK